MSRFRVLHLRASNFAGGPEQQLLRYAESERDGCYEVYLGSFIGGGDGSDFLRAAEARGLQILSLPTRNFGPRSGMTTLMRELQIRKIDLLCTHGFKADVLGVLAGRSARVPVACFLRGWTRENFKVRIYEVAERLALRFADRIVCLSELQATKLSRRTTLSNKVRIVRNAIDVAAIDEAYRISSRREVRRRFGLPQNCLVVASGGRLSPEKGTCDFLEASSIIGPQFKEARFLIFGEGVLRQQLELKAYRLGIRDQVSFVGFERDLRRLLPGIDLLVNPSHSEEMPNIVLEGMAAGIPIVATAVGALEEIAGPERALCLVPPAQPKILAEAIGGVLGQPLRAKEMAQMGRSRVERVYSLAEQRCQFHALYQEFLDFSHLGSMNLAQNRVPAGEQDSVPLPVARYPDMPPFLSVVIPVRQEELHIGAVLAELENQDYPHDRLEVLVADGNSTDGTAKVVEEFARQTSVCVRLLRNPVQLSSAGRNVGLRKARGEYIIFIDGHCHIPSKTLLRDVVELFEKTRADCLSRPQPLTMPGNDLFQEVVAHARATFLGHGWDSTIYATDVEGFVSPQSSGAIYRRNVFERIGYYDDDFDACEDVEFNHRVFKAGLRSYLHPRLTVHYRPRGTLRSLWIQMIRYGRGRFRLLCKHRDCVSLSQIIPAGLWLGLVLGGIASLMSAWAGGILVSILAVYLGTVFYFSFRLAIRFGRQYLLWAPAIYVTIHLGLGAGLLTGTWAMFSRRDKAPKRAGVGVLATPMFASPDQPARKQDKFSNSTTSSPFAAK
jgi:succinoglycan biosynthesis protein ExoA